MSECVVELCAGGHITLLSNEEVDRWQTRARAYREDFDLTVTSDLAQLDMILQQDLISFRAQQRLSGLAPEFDDEGLPTGKMEQIDLGNGEQERLQRSMLNAGKEIGRLETALGIDKRSREAGGRGGVDDYLATLRRAAAEYGVHIVERVKLYEQFCMDLRWRVRLNENGDDEDKRYENCMDEGIIRWAREQLEELEEVDREFAREKGKLWLGQL